MSQKLLSCAVACVAIVSSSSVLAAPPDLDEVVELTRAGVSAEVIIQRMKDEGARYDLSTDEALALVEGGVSEQVINYMLSTRPAPEPTVEAPPEPAPAPPEAPVAPKPVTIESLADLIAMHEGGATEAEMIGAVERSRPLRVSPEELIAGMGLGTPRSRTAPTRAWARPGPGSPGSSRPASRCR